MAGGQSSTIQTGVLIDKTAVRQPKRKRNGLGNSRDAADGHIVERYLCPFPNSHSQHPHRTTIG
ncbi:MAG TPA: hypothetical protein PLD25_03335 [Chloroflexota bacterium]|nr:hypothetical protein [Chloroflexota bacterium]HUM71507.1 hypothetical protein [Chloroflexota bacterium]